MRYKLFQKATISGSVRLVFSFFKIKVRYSCYIIIEYENALQTFSEINDFRFSVFLNYFIFSIIAQFQNKDWGEYAKCLKFLLST